MQRLKSKPKDPEIQKNLIVGWKSTQKTKPRTKNDSIA